MDKFKDKDLWIYYHINDLSPPVFPLFYGSQIIDHRIIISSPVSFYNKSCKEKSVIIISN